jgi:hypothetical protein
MKVSVYQFLKKSEMKSIFTILVSVLILLVLQTACKKTEEKIMPQQQLPPITFDSMFHCHAQTIWDSATIHNALLGKWQWTFIKCYWNPEDANSEEYKNLSLEFKNDNTLVVKIDGQISQTATWNVMNLNDGYFKLLVSQFVPQLFGRILFCGDKVLFYDSYTDGCDNYFKKQN